MKTINLILYTFDELSKEVQKQIIDRERWNVMEQCACSYGTDYHNSLDKFEELMDIFVPNWKVGYDGYYCHVKIDVKYAYYETVLLEHLSGKLLVRYLQNNILPSLMVPKHYYAYKRVNDKSILKSRASRIIKVCDCPLTGTCYDMYLIDPILKYIQNPTPQTTYEDLIDECVESFFKEWHKEYQYWADNEDFIREELHNNQYEDRLYYKNGQVYDGPLEDVA